MRTRTAIAAVLALVFVCAGSSKAAATEQEGKIVPEKSIKASKIIRVHYLGGITPAEVTVAPGTTVIWLNDSRASVELRFMGKQVTMACKSPVHFIVDENGSFISDRIPQGSVASLCFVEKGEFEYAMRKSHTYATQEQRPSIKEFKGKVIVK